jgi:site-specific recombinase XerD
MLKYEYKDIDTDVQFFRDSIRDKYILHRILFELLIVTGLRFTEARESERASKNENGEYIWITLKGNNNRTLPAEVLPREFINEHDKNPYFLNSISQSTANNFFLRNFPKPLIYHQNKSLKSHIFRHYNMKKMYDQGLGINEISAYFGEIDDKNTENYVFSNLLIPD